MNLTLLYQKAFLLFFTGLTLFFDLLVLPLIVAGAALSYDSAWLYSFTWKWAIVFLVLAFMVVQLLMSLAFSKDRDVRTEQLLLGLQYGKEFFLHWNPIGWLILLGPKAGKVLVLAYVFLRVVIFRKEEKLPHNW